MHILSPVRILFVQYGLPEPFRMTCVMRGRWRLLSDIKGPAQGGPELYDLASDPMQRTNLVAALPDLAKELRTSYDAWWSKTEPLTRQRAIHSCEPTRVSPRRPTKVRSRRGSWSADGTAAAESWNAPSPGAKSRMSNNCGTPAAR